jgi:hypothetical protein
MKTLPNAVTLSLLDFCLYLIDALAVTLVTLDSYCSHPLVYISHGQVCLMNTKAIVLGCRMQVQFHVISEIFVRKSWHLMSKK